MVAKTTQEGLLVGVRTFMSLWREGYGQPHDLSNGRCDQSESRGGI